jgi:2-desacetyl-2-hydroxyethyl bacteriochlorophyllide A dehydrogenase
MESRCVTFTSPGKVELCDLEISTLADDEVKIATTKSLISTGTEVRILISDYPEDSAMAKNKRFSLPFKAGYANVGRVVEVGKDVKNIKPGMRVATEAFHADYVVYKEKSCHLIPDEIDDDVATFFVIAEITMQAVRRSCLKLGEAVVVYGLGLIGQLAGILAKENGAFPVIGIDVSPKRIELAKASGFDFVIDGSKENVIEEVKHITKGRMVDCIFEATANSDIFAQEMDLLHDQGKFIILSSPTKKVNLDFHGYVNIPSHTIIGAHNFSHPSVETYANPWTIKRDVELFFDMLKSNKFSIKHLITDRYMAKDAPDAYKKLIDDRGNMMGVIIDWT